jgi:hypothetical protein
MTEPCKRHMKRRTIEFRLVTTEDRTKFAVGERRECIKCGDIAVRIASVKGRGNLLGKSPREALTNYGCTPDEIDAYMAKHHPEEAARERLAMMPAAQPAPIPVAWPFPCSTRFNPDGSGKGAA